MKIEVAGYRWHSDIKRKLLESCVKGLPRSRFVMNASDDADIVVVWGTGHPTVMKLFESAKLRGACVVGFDLGYWQREGRFAHYRFSVNAPHPQAVVMLKDRDPARWQHGDFHLMNNFHDPKGPVYLIGMGAKSAATYNEGVGDWERAKYAELLRCFPKREIVFRPRMNANNDFPLGRNVTIDKSKSIYEVLKGAGLAVCRNSNVAVDACRTGVPVVCEDGAAAAIYPTRLCDWEKQPAFDLRQRFLSNLAWFQYSESELTDSKTWDTILEICAMAKGAIK